MKTIRIGLVLVFLLVLQVFATYVIPLNAQSAGLPDVFVGIDMAYGDSVAEAKRQIDAVAAYTNLFVLGCKGITYNTARLNETCQYLADKGLNFIVYRDTSLGRNATWAEMAKKTWGDRFLGYYAFDELGGWQIDMQDLRVVTDKPANYSDAANLFVSGAKVYLDRFARFRNTTQFNLYTSDYALYWFVYSAGYDTVFAEFGWNYSRQLNIALCRGAANMNGKDWGAIITWTYKQPPYLESGEELYKDLVLAYENGAKYIILFDANEGWTQSVLDKEHYDALNRFWGYMKQNPRQNTKNTGRVAYVLPRDYGYGFRGPDDKIWGFWETDSLAGNVCSGLSQLFSKYGEKLDIIYDYGLQPGNTYGYDKLFYWNDSSLIKPATSETDSAQTLWSTPTVVSQPPSNPPPVENPSPPMDYSLVVVATAAIAGVTVPAVVLRKRQHCITFATTGIGRDFTGTVIVVDGQTFDRYGSSFWWDRGSRHSFEFKSPLFVNGTKQYILTSTSGLPTHESDVLKASMDTTVTGNYRLVLKTCASTRTR
jgi:hypothetical protein